MHWSSAVSTAHDLEAAVNEAATAIRAGMAGQSIDLVAAFISHQFAPRYAELTSLLHAALPHAHLFGCSAGGVIGGGREIEQQPGLSLTAAHLPGVTLAPFVLRSNMLPDADASPRAWSHTLGIDLEPAPQFLLLGDPFSFPVTKLLAGLDYAFPRSIKMGGLASGARKSGGNALYLGGELHREGFIGMALRGDLSLRTIVAQGCRPVGKPVTISSCHDNFLLEIDGRPALQIVEDMLRDLPESDRRLAQRSLFLGVLMDTMTSDPEPGGFLIRNIVGMDPESGALAIGEMLRGGQIVQFHVRDAEASSEDLIGLLDRFVRGDHAAAACGALLFSCLGRGMHLYGCPDHDTQCFVGKLSQVPLGGFFCNGEIGPVGGATYLHGYTSCFGIFGPAAPK